MVDKNQFVTGEKLPSQTIPGENPGATQLPAGQKPIGGLPNPIKPSVPATKPVEPSKPKEPEAPKFPVEAELKRMKSEQKDLQSQIVKSADEVKAALAGRAIGEIPVTGGDPYWVAVAHHQDVYRLLKNLEDKILTYQEWGKIPPEPPVASAPPVVNSLNPSSAALGSPSFVLHVMGTGFDPASVIVWNGSNEPTTFVSPTEVTTSVNMSTAEVAMPIPVAVRNPDGVTSAAKTFTLTAAPGTLSTKLPDKK